jgi:hypothetical protein
MAAKSTPAVNTLSLAPSSHPAARFAQLRITHPTPLKHYGPLALAMVEHNGVTAAGGDWRRRPCPRANP